MRKTPAAGTIQPETNEPVSIPFVPEISYDEVPEKTKDIARYLIADNVKRFGECPFDITPWGAWLKAINILKERYGIIAVRRAARLATLHAKHRYTAWHLEDYMEGVTCKDS